MTLLYFLFALISSATLCFFVFAVRTLRPTSILPLAPRSLFLLVASNQLILLPLVIALSSPSQGVLVAVAEENEMLVASGIVFLAVLSCIAGYAAAARSPALGVVARPRSNANRSFLSYALFSLALGLAGFVFAFSDLDSLRSYYTDSTSRGIAVRLEGDLQFALGLFLRPFLGYGAMLLIAFKYSDGISSRSSRIGLKSLWLLVVLVIVLANMSFGFNRGALVAPLLALAGAYSRTTKRLRPVSIVVTLALALPFLLFLGLYRSSGLDLQTLVNAPQLAEYWIDDFKANDKYQEYSLAPQYSAAFLDSYDWPSQRLAYEMPLCSVITPLPVIGKVCRQDSGPARFNLSIYGSEIAQDLILPAATELAVGFHLPGVVLGFGLLGNLLYRLDKRYHESSSFVDSYNIIYSTIWLVQLLQGGIAILSQIIIYTSLPIAGYYLWSIYALRKSSAR